MKPCKNRRHLQESHAHQKLPRDAEDFEWDLGDCVKIVGWLAESAPVFASVLADAVKASGSGVLSTIVYLDEITPGNILAPDNKRTTTGTMNAHLFASCFDSRAGFILVLRLRIYPSERAFQSCRHV